MSNHKKHLIELIMARGYRVGPAAGMAQNILAQYALIPRADLPVMSEKGVTPNEWWDRADCMSEPDRARQDAAYNLARAEWLEAREAAEAETKLSERRNKVLADIRKRQGTGSTLQYEDYNVDAWTRITVNMILEAQDGAGK